MESALLQVLPGSCQDNSFLIRLWSALGPVSGGAKLKDELEQLPKHDDGEAVEKAERLAAETRISDALPMRP